MSFKLNPLFSDNGVFAKGRPIRIFGEGDCEVTAAFRGSTKAVRSENGKFLIEFPAVDEYGGPYTLTVSAEGREYTFNNIYIGEVLILGGQSNLQFKVWQSSTEKGTVAPNDKLRFFMLERPEKEYNGDKGGAEGSQIETIFPEDGWVLHTEENLKQWSLLGTRMAEFIAERRGCVVGLIGCYQGASAIEGWLPRELCDLPPYDIPVETKRPFNHLMMPCKVWNANGFLYDYMWSKLIPYSVNHLIWYQGESDYGGPEADVYDYELKALIKRYREDMQSPELSFVIIQISDLDEIRDIGWKKVQEAQMRAAEQTENCICVVSRDVCESDDIHPPTKIHLAKRIADSLGY